MSHNVVSDSAVLLALYWAPVAEGTLSENRRLDSWKEIAQYLRREVRTVQRWETLEGLPVHRHPHAKLSSVYALTDEIDAWQRAREAKLQSSDVSAQPPSRRRYLWVAAACATSIAVVLFAIHPWGRSFPAAVSIAVLPLANLSGSSEQEFFADGMTDELITMLAKTGELPVISRAAVVRYKNTAKPMQQISRELGVTHIVEGTVLRDNDRIRITAQLIEVASGHHVWAETYQRQVKDVLALQHDVAQAIARRVHARIRPGRAESVPPRPVNPVAYEAFLRGKYQAARGAPNDHRNAIEYFKQAVNADPDFAPAYAQLADSYNVLVSVGAIDASEALPEARQAIKRALALDNDLADAHTSLASLYEFDFDWVNAEKHYREALTINPNYSKAHHWYAEMLARLGRFKESLTGLERAKNLDPVSPVTLSVLGMAYCANFREFSKADEQWNHALNLYPKLSLPFALKMNCFLWTGQHAQGIEWFEANRSHIVSSPSLASSLGYAYAMTGLEGKARRIVNDLTSRVERGGVTSLHVAVVYVGLRDKNRAFLWLEKAYEARNWELGFLQVHPCYATLLNDPRYLSLAKRMRLEQVRNSI